MINLCKELGDTKKQFICMDSVAKYYAKIYGDLSAQVAKITKWHAEELMQL